ncbi:septum formation initiator, partial [Bacillus luti]
MRGDAVVANKKRNDAMAIGIAIGIVIGVVPRLFTDNLVIGIVIG